MGELTVFYGFLEIFLEKKNCQNPISAILGSFVHKAEGGLAKGLSGLSTKKDFFAVSLTNYTYL